MDLGGADYGSYLAAAAQQAEADKHSGLLSNAVTVAMNVGGIDYEPYPAAAAQRAEAEKHSGPVCGGRDSSRTPGGAAGQDDDVIEVVEVGDLTREQGSRPWVTGRGDGEVEAGDLAGASESKAAGGTRLR
eukprot:scaffold190034_cov21-Tisochrysis_lutea.AAC.2